MSSGREERYVLKVPNLVRVDKNGYKTSVKNQIPPHITKKYQELAFVKSFYLKLAALKILKSLLLLYNFTSFWP